MDNKEPQNCWEFWNCPEDVRGKCPAYTENYGKECWFFAYHFCPRISKGFAKCWECPWFKKLNPGFHK